MLSDNFLNTLVDELDSSEIVGIVLGGSYARDDATVYSDVDIACFVRDEKSLSRKRFFYRDGYLVSLATKTIEGVRKDLTRPKTAIWVVPGFSHCRVLVDKYGSVTKLLRDIEAFTWGPLQEEADNYASFNMMMLVELVHKILSETLKGDDLALSYATSKLFSGLTDVVAVQRGVYVKSDNTYYHQVQASVGLESPWTLYHRLITGAAEMPLEVGNAKSQAVAALHLYRETLELLRPVMNPDHLSVAEQAMHIVDKANL